MKTILITILTLTLFACATPPTHAPHEITPLEMELYNYMCSLQGGQVEFAVDEKTAHIKGMRCAAPQ